LNQAKDLAGPMSPSEIRASLSLAGIYMLRMIGLFLILPVFSIYARDLSGSTPLLTGLAISAYGLTQALFQIPFGMLSDRYGRKRLITIGLIVFAIGSAMAALSTSIYGVIAGRVVQGAGAVAAVVMALAADLTREEHRTKAMAVIGVSIGVSFALSMVAGPVLSSWMGVRGLFWIVTALALLGIVVLFTWVPAPAVSRFHRDTQAEPAQFSAVLANRELLRLDFGILALHAILTALFVAVPLILRDAIQLETSHHWAVYLPVFLLSLITMVPFIILAEKRHRMKLVFTSFIALIALSTAGLAWFHQQLITVGSLLYVFFTGFNLLEATLPSLISKVAPPDLKGTAMGIYSTAQFLGAFIGGVSGGWIYGKFGLPYVFLFCAGVAALWLLVAIDMKPPRYLSSLLINLGALDEVRAAQYSERIAKVAGVAEVVVLAEDGVAYLKVDKEKLDRQQLNLVLQAAEA
jgi:MFS family permease